MGTLYKYGYPPQVNEVSLLDDRKPRVKHDTVGFSKFKNTGTDTAVLFQSTGTDTGAQSINWYLLQYMQSGTAPSLFIPQLLNRFSRCRDSFPRLIAAAAVLKLAHNFTVKKPDASDICD